MHRGIVGVLSGEVIPLTAGPQPEDDGIEDGALVDALATA